ncbi:ABC transporter ATP-binding protein [Colibacter massiliensis]|uniref:ABC transporter ATP-binding protein n=1 Tax=Colibacter massiliensis TaxID=1852379 RepID=UPI00094EA61F|nr:ABC transporter ATP-binding protein [Colibacter massiliensis]
MKLDVEQLSFGYDDRKVLDNISFSFEGNRIVTLLGKNGTGKSTLLKCIIGENKGTGNVRIDGRSRRDYSYYELARKIAYIPQSHVPIFPYRVLDVVMMGRISHMRYFGVPGKTEQEMALKNLDFLGVAPLAPKAYTEISGGERQLVMLAAALTQEPEFLILDEPTAHLDFGNAQRFLDLVLRLQSEGIGIFMTTHFPDQALYLASETLILKDTKLWKRGLAKEIIDEASMTELYGLPVHIGDIGKRSVSVAGDI